MAIASLPEAGPLPRSIRRGLGRVGRRLRTATLVRGLGLVALATAAGAALGAAADLATVLPGPARWLIWGSWVAAGLATLALAVLRPLARRAGWAELAAVAERGEPALGERLTGAVGLHGRPHGSPALIAALAADAEHRARSLRPGRGVGLGRPLRRLAAGALAWGLLALPALVRPDPFGRILRRALAPWSAAERVGRFLVEVRPGDAVVAAGGDLAILGTVRPRYGNADAPEAALVEWSVDGGRPRRTPMAPQAEGPARVRSFEATLPRLAGTARYRVVAGTGTSPWHTITAVEPPAVALLDVTVAPPAYTRRPAAKAADPSRIEAWEGSTITLVATPSKPVRSLSVAWPEGPSKSRDVPLKADPGGQTWSTVVSAKFSGSYLFALRDGHDLANFPGAPRRLLVRPDAPPTVALGGGDDPRPARPDDVLLVEVQAADDLAVADIELHYAVARQRTGGEPEPGVVPAPMAGLGTPNARGEAALNLRPLELRPGDTVSYRIRVADNRPAPAGPNIAWSQARSLGISEKADALAAGKADAERSGLLAKLEALKALAEANRKAAEQLRYAADAASRGNGPWGKDRDQALVDAEKGAREAVEKLQQLAGDFQDSGTFEPLARAARQLAEVEAEGGREMLDRAGKAADASKRLDDLKQADGRLAATVRRVDELRRKFDELAKQDDDRRRLRALAEQQEALATRAEALAANGGDPSKLDEVRQEQERLRREVDEITRRSPDLRAEALAAQARQAEALARKAEDLARRQREEAAKTADPAGRAETLQKLAEAQQALEDDARRLAMQVDEPLAENGRARLDAEALARAVEPIKRGDVGAGRERLENAEDALRRLARDLDDVRDDPRALARRLARRQEALGRQVEEATRDLNNPDRKAALGERLKPLAAAEAAIAGLAAAIPAPADRHDQAKAAAESTDRASKSLDPSKSADEMRGRQNEARDALNRLADSLPDANQRREQARQRAGEARQRAEQVAAEVDQHLRDTAPRPGQPHDPAAAAAELARRLAPLAARAEEAAAGLKAIEAEPRARPQQDRAAHRAQDLADTLDAVRDAAPPKSADPQKAAADWHLLGPFDAKQPLPFSPGGFVDLKSAHKGRKDAPIAWRPVKLGDRGLVDLGSIYSRDDNQAAYGYAEITSPTRGPGRLLIGSDDSATVWLNGRLVHDFNGSRLWDPDRDKVDVVLEAGVNRLVVRCGNGNGEWKFSASVLPPPPPEVARKLDRVQELRAALPAVALDAKAAAERLEKALQGREPADDRAAELAAEARKLDGGKDPAGARKLAASLRNLDAPDASLARDQAARAADRAAMAAAEGKPEAADLARAAAVEAQALADRLADASTPADRAAALARVERGLNMPDAPRDAPSAARDQRRVAAELARLPTEGKAAATALVDRAAALAEQPGDPAPLADARRRAADAIGKLAQAQPPKADPAAPANPKAAAESLAARQRALADEIRQGKADASTADRLHELAREARSLPSTPQTPGRPDPQQPRQEAREAQRRAADALARGEPNPSADAAKQAAEALDQLAQALPSEVPKPAPTPADPGLDIAPAQAEAARDLARRERAIREQLQAVLGERVAPQDRLKAEAAALGKELEALRDQSREVGPRGHGPANQAADLMGRQAPQAMARGSDALAKGQVDQARDAQRQAADLAEQAARQADDLAAALRADRPAEASQKPGEGQAEGLAQARSAQDRARRQLDQARESPSNSGAAKDASGSMRQAAEGLRAASASRKGGKEKGQSTAKNDAPPDGSPEGTQTDPQGGPAGRGEADLAQLQALMRQKTGRAWGELPGHLRTEIMQMSQGKYRDDYARLIQLYYREIAADKGSKGAKP